MKTLRRLLALTFPLLATLSARATITNVVTSAADDGGAGTLRKTIASASAGSVITFSNTLSGATILLTNGSIMLKANFDIDASALPGGIIIDGNHSGNYGVFDSISGITNTLTLLTITNGATDPYASGGGIVSRGNLTLNRCTLAGNSTGLGGGIYNDGVLALNQCTLAGNSAGGGGGGIYNNSGTVTVNQSTLAGNSAVYGGGGIANNNSGTVTVNQSTLAGNSAGAYGGGIYSLGTLNLTNSIVAGNMAPTVANILGPINTSGGVNLTSDAPLLAPLGNYGGPTQTMPPLPGSPAIDGCTNGAPTFTTDQRGLPRIAGPYADIGAVEGVYAANYSGPGQLIGATWLASGAGGFQFGFTNYPGLNTTFSVWASTNLALPFSQWSRLGAVTDAPAGSGRYQFTDPQATNSVQRFYRVSSP